MVDTVFAPINGVGLVRISQEHGGNIAIFGTDTAHNARGRERLGEKPLLNFTPDEARKFAASLLDMAGCPKDGELRHGN